MILLKRILESMDRGNARSWQEPNGKFHDLMNRETHADWALRYLDLDVGGNIHQQNDAVMMMWKKGWMRVTFSGDAIYAHNETRLPNEKQLNELIELAKDANFSKVVGDSGENYKILWSEFDVCENCKIPTRIGCK